MTMLRKAVAQALDFVEFLWREAVLNDYAEEKREETQLALMAALAQPEQAEPVAYRYWKDKFACWEYSDVPLEFPAVPAGVEMEPLYTTPPRREWVGLTDEEIASVTRDIMLADHAGSSYDVAVASAIEAALKERNHG